MSCSFRIIFTVCRETLLIPRFLSSPRILVEPQLFSRASLSTNSRMSSVVWGRPDFRADAACFSACDASFSRIQRTKVW